MTLIDCGTLAILLLGSLAFAGTAPVTLDGNALLPKCQNAVHIADGDTANDIGGSYCLGFVSGIMIMASDWQASEKTTKVSFLPCLPSEGMTSGQAVRVVTKYLDSHPERLHRDAHILVIEALKEAFPCGSEAPK
jgi:hypothetical protein